MNVENYLKKLSELKRCSLLSEKTDKKNDGSGENDKCHMTYNIGSVPVALVG